MVLENVTKLILITMHKQPKFMQKGLWASKEEVHAACVPAPMTKHICPPHIKLY